MNPARGAGDGRQEIQLTVMIPIELPVLCNLAFRFLVKVLVRLARVKKLSVSVPVPRRSAPAVVPKAEVEHKVLSPIPNVAHEFEVSPLVAVDSGDRTLSLDLGPCGTKAGRQALACPVVSLSSSNVRAWFLFLHNRRVFEAEFAPSRESTRFAVVFVSWGRGPAD